MQLLLPLLTLFATTNAECACGYTVNSTNSKDYALFTDLLETDFLHTRAVTRDATGWWAQDYDTPVLIPDGKYGMAKATRNIVPNYIDIPYNYAGLGSKGVDPGLQLWVRSAFVYHEDYPGLRLVPSAELVTERADILYGSFRIAMKTTSVNGTCGAFYFYRNDSQEVDLEILSAEQDAEPKDWPIHLVVQSTRVVTGQWQDSSSQKIYMMTSPPGGPLANYNEYRFDWMPGRIEYYVNGMHVWTTTENVPSTPGRIHLSHWSNGNRYWEQGPPTHDAKLTVSYVKAYFNSSDSTRQHQYSYACPSANQNVLKQTCKIPTQNAPPNPFGLHGNETGRTFFFTQQHNMTVNQTVYGASNSLEGLRSVTWAISLFAVLVGLAL